LLIIRRLFTIRNGVALARRKSLHRAGGGLVPRNQEAKMAAEKKAKGKAGAGAKGGAGSKAAAGARGGGGSATKTAARKARGGLATPVKPDSTLAKVVGGDSVTRAVLTKKVWDYVKKNDLQDPKDRRTIRADAKLRPVFGGKDSVSMFEMTKLVNQHVGPA
jgi:upstream activation factor subunit UAF30